LIRKEEYNDLYAKPLNKYNGSPVIDNKKPGAVQAGVMKEGARFIDGYQGRIVPEHAAAPQPGFNGAGYCCIWRAFKITEGFADAFGKARVRNTPICESADCWRLPSVFHWKVLKR
jgi:hypothetical protein